MTSPAKRSSEPRRRTLSEHASKAIVAQYGVHFARERLVTDADQALAAASEIGFPVVVKLCGDAIAHKTERQLVRVGVADAAALRIASQELLAAARPEDGSVGLLVAQHVKGQRELIAGLLRDPEFGPCVLLGLGGILAEALADVVFALAPIDPSEFIGLVLSSSFQSRLVALHSLRSPNAHNALPWAGQCPRLFLLAVKVFTQFTCTCKSKLKLS